MLVDSTLFNVCLSRALTQSNSTLVMMHPYVCKMPNIRECMFQPTVAVSVSRQTMLVGGVSTTKCAVVLQLLVLMKHTGYRLYK